MEVLKGVGAAAPTHAGTGAHPDRDTAAPGTGVTPDPARVRVHVTLPRALARKLDLWKRWTCHDVSRLFEVWIETEMAGFEVREGKGR